MALLYDYNNFVITVPKADMLLIQSTPSEVRQLDIDDLRQWLHDEQDDERGITFVTMFENIPPKTISGVTLARVLEIIPPWTLQFDDNGGADPYSVNVVGGNSNLADVIIKNTVGVNTANSAGLQVVAGGGGSWSEVLEDVYTAGDIMRLLLSTMVSDAVYTPLDNGSLQVTYKDVLGAKDRFTIQYNSATKTLDKGNIDAGL